MSQTENNNLSFILSQEAKIGTAPQSFIFTQEPAPGESGALVQMGGVISPLRGPKGKAPAILWIQDSVEKESREELGVENYQVQVEKSVKSLPHPNKEVSMETP